MKLLLLISVISSVFSGCGKSHPVLSLSAGRQNQVIAFQPLGAYSRQDMDAAVKEIAQYFNKKIIILNPIEIPLRFFNPVINQYSADSIIHLLSRLQNDSIVEVIGLTHQPVFTIKHVKAGGYFDEKIFGMGYQPGNACVVSDFTFGIPDTNIHTHRLKIVVMHEIGHNMGLPHCSDGKCIMSENNGSLRLLDNSAAAYCAQCSKKIKH